MCNLQFATFCLENKNWQENDLFSSAPVCDNRKCTLTKIVAGAPSVVQLLRRYKPLKLGVSNRLFKIYQKNNTRNDHMIFPSLWDFLEGKIDISQVQKP